MASESEGLGARLNDYFNARVQADNSRAHRAGAFLRHIEQKLNRDFCDAIRIVIDPQMAADKTIGMTVLKIDTGTAVELVAQFDLDSPMEDALAEKQYNLLKSLELKDGSGRVCMRGGRFSILDEASIVRFCDDVVSVAASALIDKERRLARCAAFAQGYAAPEPDRGVA